MTDRTVRPRLDALAQTGVAVAALDRFDPEAPQAEQLAALIMAKAALTVAAASVAEAVTVVTQQIATVMVAEAFASLGAEQPEQE